MPKTLTPSDKIHIDKTLRHIESRSGWKIVSPVEQGTTRDSAVPMAKPVGDVERPTTSGHCAGQTRDSSRTRDHQGMVG